jgi:simple sugar transport system ATP-binding protein
LCGGRLSGLRNTTDTQLSDVGGWMAGQFDHAPSAATV